MKITHHLGRFATFFKQSSLVIQLVMVVSGIGIIAGTATVAAMVATPNNNRASTRSATSESGHVAGDTDSKPFTPSASERVDTTSSDQTAREPAATTPTRKITQSPEATTTPPTQTPTTSQQTAAIAPTPVTAPTCNESMKSSYTSLYNSQLSSRVNAENANWYRQIEAWNNEAAGRGVGGAFSGYVQSLINDNKPAHDARLAQIQAQLQTQYYQNLASINCNP